MADAPFATFEITFASDDDASVGRHRLERAGFTIEAGNQSSAVVRAGITDRDGDAGAKLDMAVEGLSYDPVIYWQSTTLDSFT
jgi:hypothetical protein